MPTEQPQYTCPTCGTPWTTRMFMGGGYCVRCKPVRLGSVRWGKVFHHELGAVMVSDQIGGGVMSVEDYTAYVRDRDL